MNLIKAELLKLVYARRNYGLLLASIAISVLGAAFSPYAMSKLTTLMPNPLGTADAIDGIYAKALGGYMFTLILGVIIMASEFNQHTAISTYLAAPKRYQPLLAKLIVAAAAGAIVNFIATWVGMGSAAIALSFYPDAATPHDYIWLDYSAVSLLTGAVLALIGVGIGSLIRNQNAAVTTGLIWIFLVDRILALLFTDVGKWLPTGLITAMMNLKLDVKAQGISINTADYLEPWPAAGMLLLYGVVFAVISLVTSSRRDID